MTRTILSRFFGIVILLLPGFCGLLAQQLYPRLDFKAGDTVAAYQEIVRVYHLPDHAAPSFDTLSKAAAGTVIVKTS